MFKKRNKKNDTTARQRSSVTKAPNPVFSYHSKRSTSEVERTSRNDVFDQNTKQANRSLKHVPTYFAVIIIAASLFYVTLLGVDKPQIVLDTNVTPSILHDTAYYQKGVAETLNKSLFNRSKITIDTKHLSDQLLEQFPELETATIVTPLFGKRPIVRMSATTPVLVVTANNGQFIVGTNGKVLMGLSEAPSNQVDSLIHVKDALSDDLQPGDVVLPLSTIHFIEDLQQLYKDRGLTISDVELPAVANEVHVKLAGDKYYTKFNLQEDINQQVGTYFAVIENIKSQNKALPTEYVDVRVAGRAYYK